MYLYFTDFPERGIMVIDERNAAVHYQFHVSLQYQRVVIWIGMYTPEMPPKNEMKLYASHEDDNSVLYKISLNRFGML